MDGQSWVFIGFLLIFSLFVLYSIIRNAVKNGIIEAYKELHIKIEAKKETSDDVSNK